MQTVLYCLHNYGPLTCTAEIIVLNKGHVEESGTHDELLAKRGMYHNMWEQQQHAAPGIDVEEEGDAKAETKAKKA